MVCSKFIMRVQNLTLISHFILRARSLFRRHRYGLIGNYTDWIQAKAHSDGYAAEIILQKTTAALRRVKIGEFACERDTVLFHKVQYSWPLLAGLMWVAARNTGRLNVLDVGGSLGSTYFQNRTFLDGLDFVRWNIVEQLGHVKVGQREFQDKRLHFYETIAACLEQTSPDLVLLCSVLQYLEHPYNMIDSLLNIPCRFLIIDRTPFWDGAADRLSVQKVPAEIYPASYPSWIFSTQQFHSHLALNWDVVTEFDSQDRLPAPVPLTYRGLIATRRQSLNQAFCG